MSMKYLFLFSIIFSIVGCSSESKGEERNSTLAHTTKDVVIKNLEKNETKPEMKKAVELPKDTLFTINDKPYTIDDFPKAYQELTQKQKEEFVARYLFYKLFFKGVQAEKSIYQKELDQDLKKAEAELKRKGIVLNPIQKIIFEDKTVADALAYHVLIHKKKFKEVSSRAQEFYEKHKEGYRYPARIEVSEIVLKDKNSSLSVIKAVKEHNNSIEFFAELATKQSINPKTAKNGGYVGEISAQTMGKEIFDKLWNAKEGTVFDEPIAFKNYYHVVYVLEKHQPEQRTFEEEKRAIEENILKKNMQHWKRKKFQKVRKETEVKFYGINIP